MLEKESSMETVRYNKIRPIIQLLRFFLVQFGLLNKVLNVRNQGFLFVALIIQSRHQMYTLRLTNADPLSSHL